MSELAATAERLRVVKNACLDFITLWALDRMMAENGLCDRIHGDVLNVPRSETDGGSERLYSGRVSDD